MTSRVSTTLVTGISASVRERAIAALLDVPSADACAPPNAGSAVILEGLAASEDPLVSTPTLKVVRIAPGCLCCDGNLVLRVTLNRLLRQRPQRLFIGLARSEHLDQLRSWLQDAPYDQLLVLNPVVQA